MAKSSDNRSGKSGGKGLGGATDKLAELAQNPLARSMLAAGLVTAAAALTANQKVRQTAKKAGRDALEGAESAADNASKVGTAILNAATEAVRRFMATATRSDSGAGTSTSGRSTAKRASSGRAKSSSARSAKAKTSSGGRKSGAKAAGAASTAKPSSRGTAAKAATGGRGAAKSASGAKRGSAKSAATKASAAKRGGAKGSRKAGATNGGTGGTSA